MVPVEEEHNNGMPQGTLAPTVVCYNCKEPNKQGSRVCSNCKMILSFEVLQEQQEVMKSMCAEFEEMRKDQEDMIQWLREKKRWISENMVGAAATGKKK